MKFICNSFLDYTELPNLEKEKIQKQCTHCNDKKIAAKSVQDLSNSLFFAAFVKVRYFILLGFNLQPINLTLS